MPEPLDESRFSSVLCVVAHPDDIEYGLSAAVARWTQAGTKVTYFLLTRGEAGIDPLPPAEAGPIREEEELASAAVVGVTDVHFGTHRDGAIEYGLPLRRDIAREIRRVRPDLVVGTFYGDRYAGGQLNQADHRAVGQATVDAVADAGNRWIFEELVAQEGLHPWKVTTLAISPSPTGTHYVDVSATFEDAVASLEAHTEYNRALSADYPAPRELLGSILGGAAQAVGDPAVTHAVSLDVFER
ncbi:PIG-L deacetylase family protein [Kribbia dieselivorans]|uniref:PIG-L deacetylase family protein n=1 Tax=Kribbia dieselivorans TaxID=331526 RepID=UPI000AAA1A0A|nr:PIG-L deacetylase family protein [Kribbia dieselivorans]